MKLPEMGDLVNQAQKMQARMNELQQQLAMRRFEGSAGAGMVRAVVNGQLRVLEIHLEDAVFEGRDKDMIQDLTAAAVNAALAHAQAEVQREIQSLQSQLAIPLGPAAAPGTNEPR